MKKREPTQYEKMSAKRIRQLIEERCDGSQQAFADKVGIGKASVSQYVNETNYPNNKTCGKIAAAFGLEPMWVMGFDQAPRSGFLMPYHLDELNDSIGKEFIKKQKLAELSEAVNARQAVQKNEHPMYYTDPVTARMAQKYFEDENFRVLFDAAEDSSPENIKLAAEMLRRMKESK